MKQLVLVVELMGLCVDQKWMDGLIGWIDGLMVMDRWIDGSMNRWVDG